MVFSACVYQLLCAGLGILVIPCCATSRLKLDSGHALLDDAISSWDHWFLAVRMFLHPGRRLTQFDLTSVSEYAGDLAERGVVVGDFEIPPGILVRSLQNKTWARILEYVESNNYVGDGQQWCAHVHISLSMLSARYIFSAISYEPSAYNYAATQADGDMVGNLVTISVSTVVRMSCVVSSCLETVVQCACFQGVHV
eukprot:CAMPEP_0114283768 /NCGR_PEP_ID=MMETSP0059-20121206/4285_1 /TAXON_ID=36894 /ORGANISM="Pyramimonas parkeae, Strain CCMP726" /LENGTH=196 /DNA_ID=CAMNT_0001404533 /DNA_START=128 /DNA_END=718 /DNA_ORIENTATION=-